jgi:hypothetical protein
MPDLSAAEAATLLDLDNATGQEALRRTLIELTWRGLISLEQKRREGLFGFGTTTQVSCNQKPEELDGMADHTREIYRITQEVCSAGERPLDDLMSTLRAHFGANLEGYRTHRIIPSLMQRGLIEERGRSIFGLLGPMRYRLTTTGLSERERLLSEVDEARALPGRLAGNPAGSMAAIAGLGITLLLLDDLWPQLGQYGTGDMSGAGSVPAFDDSSLALLSPDAFNEASGAVDSGGYGGSDSGGFGGSFGDAGGGDGGGGGGGE